MAGIATLCGTGIYANEVACEIDSYISDFVNKAELSEAALNTALDAFTDAYENNITPINYSANTTGVNKSFVAPTTAPARGDYASLQPAEVVLPARGGFLSTAQSDAIYSRARSRITRAYAQEIRNAADQRPGLGIGLSSPALTQALTEANQRSAEGEAQSALAQAADEGTWEREDIQAIINLEVQNFQQKWSVIQGRLTAEEDTLRAQVTQYLSEVQREAERRGWSQMEINDVLQQAKDTADTAVAWGRLTMDKLMQAEEVVIRMKAAVFQTWLQAADLGLTFSGSQNVNDNSS